MSKKRTEEELLLDKSVGRKRVLGRMSYFKPTPPFPAGFLYAFSFRQGKEDVGAPFVVHVPFQNPPQTPFDRPENLGVDLKGMRHYKDGALYPFARDKALMLEDFLGDLITAFEADRYVGDAENIFEPTFIRGRFSDWPSLYHAVFPDGKERLLMAAPHGYQGLSGVRLVRQGYEKTAMAMPVEELFARHAEISHPPYVELQQTFQTLFAAHENWAEIEEAARADWVVLQTVLAGLKGPQGPVLPPEGPSPEERDRLLNVPIPKAKRPYWEVVSRKILRKKSPKP